MGTCKWVLYLIITLLYSFPCTTIKWALCNYGFAELLGFKLNTLYRWELLLHRFQFL